MTHNKWNQRGTICYPVLAYVKCLKAVIFMPKYASTIDNPRGTHAILDLVRFFLEVHRPATCKDFYDNHSVLGNKLLVG